MKSLDGTDIQISLLLKSRTEKEKRFILDVLKYAVSKLDGDK